MSIFRGPGTKRRAKYLVSQVILLMVMDLLKHNEGDLISEKEIVVLV